MTIFSFFKRKPTAASYRYRELDSYSVDFTRTPATELFVESRLPSEPPEGITYSFGPTGYLSQDRNLDYCVIYSPWRNIDNYCHWTLSEVPLIHLALESPAPNVVIPDALLTADQPFQRRWREVLLRRFGHKKVIPLSKLSLKEEGLIPLNHDTSNSTTRYIGKCPYRHYHSSRATPYCLEIMDSLRDCFARSETQHLPYIYISRTHRLLRNEAEMQRFLMGRGFSVLKLEDFSLDDQVQLFSRARMVVGFHGAGLTNLVFAQPSTAVLEIADADCVYPSYQDALLSPGHKAPRTHFHVIGAMKKLNYDCIVSSDYVLDLSALESKLEAMMP